MIEKKTSGFSSIHIQMLRYVNLRVFLSVYLEICMKNDILNETCIQKYESVSSKKKKKKIQIQHTNIELFPNMCYCVYLKQYLFISMDNLRIYEDGDVYLDVFNFFVN
eukprot:TRINITY_DN8554_c0_g1_i7.p1 TRINITY_DN8554_c0_g1~~TRINITY_DN8554_c0_g1_i7.p1  ORF type:complete len:108 (+),score=14.81 TRINITY_DN8554_c0_g1_i7:283-606(+)